MWGSKRTLNTEDDESSDVQPLTTGDLLGIEQQEDNEEAGGGERLLQEFPSSEHSSSARSGSDDGGGGAGDTSPSPDVLDEQEEDTSITTPPPPESKPDHTAPSNDKEQLDEQQDDDEKLRPGDHIWTFQWHRGWRHRRHAIVLEVTPRENTSHNLDGEEKEDLITVLTFYPAGDKTRTAKGLMAEAAGGDKEDDETATMSLIDAVDTTEEDDDDGGVTSVGAGSDSPKRGGLQRRSSSRRSENNDTAVTVVSVRSEPIELFAGKSKISKVKYNASTKNNNNTEEEKNVLKRVLRRAGIQTSLCPDDATLVVARARHLLSGDGTLPDRPPLSGSDECAAVWCRTGRWCTLRGGSILQILSAGHAGTAVAAGSVVSQATVTYVAPIGMTGWYWIWTVPATVAYPFLIPILVAYGLTSLAPLEVLRRCRKKWRHISDGLNCTFWSKTSEEIKMEYFGRTVSGDEVRMKTFFGESVKDDDDDEGKYMPVNMDGEDSDDDDEGDDDDNSGRGGFGFNRKGAMKEAATLETDVASGESSGPTRRASEGFKNPFEGLVQNWRKKWGDRDGVGSERNLGNRQNIAEHRALQKMASESLLGKTMPLKEEEEETCQLVQ